MSRYDLLLAFKDKVVSIYPEGNDSNSHCLIGSFLAKRKLCRTIKLSVDRDFYIMGESKPNYPVPALVIQLDLIAAEPMLAWEDFKAIGYYGRAGRKY